jgi:hypothetical protein
MRSVRIMLVLAASALALLGCHKKPQALPADQNTISMEDELMNGGTPANADIETLPPDESSGTPSNELANGTDNPDVNDTVTNSD